jgi:hypothetical protein
MRGLEMFALPSDVGTSPTFCLLLTFLTRFDDNSNNSTLSFLPLVIMIVNFPVLH